MTLPTFLLRKPNAKRTAASTNATRNLDGQVFVPTRQVLADCHLLRRDARPGVAGNPLLRSRRHRCP